MTTFPTSRPGAAAGRSALPRHRSLAPWLLVAVLVPAPARSAEPPPPSRPALDTFEDRRRAMLEATWAHVERTAAKPTWRNAFLVAGACFELGKIEAAHRLCHFALDGLQPGNTINRWYLGGNSGFVVWPGIDCYIRYEHLMDAALRERFRDTYTHGVFYRRFTTSNHITMAGVTRYLAVQTWGADAFTPHPRYAAEVYEALPPEQRATVRYPPSQLFANGDPDARIFVRQLVDRVVRQGPGEYASRPYGAENTLPLLTLAECARDPDLRRDARLAFELTLVQLAPVWLRGHLATFAPRSYPDMESQRPWGIAALAWLFFGGVPPADPAHEWALRAATSTYRLPEVALAAGTDRTRPYDHRALLSDWALSHHVAPGYALFARSPKHALANGRRIPFQGQSYPCGVMWDEPDTSRCSHFWLTCPAADDNAVPRNSPAGLHTHGVTAHEQEVLAGDALLWVFHVPADFRNPFALGFVPGGHRAIVNDAATTGRIYLHYGSVLLGLAASQPFDWDPDAGIRAPAVRPPPGCSEFRIRSAAATVGLDAAVAVEAAAPADFPGDSPAAQLAAFRAVLLERTRIELAPGPQPCGRYTDRTGTELSCTFNGEDTVAGRALDYRGWPILANPWMTQTGPDRLTLTDGRRTRVYDLPTWTVTDSPGDWPVSGPSP